MTKREAHAFVLVLLLVASLPMAAFSGFVFSKMWHWFLATSTGIELGMWHAAGVLVCVEFAAIRAKPVADLGEPTELFEAFFAALFARVITGLLALLLAYVIYLLAF